LSLTKPEQGAAERWLSLTKPEQDAATAERWLSLTKPEQGAAERWLSLTKPRKAPEEQRSPGIAVSSL